MKTTIEPYIATNNWSALFSLWQSTIGQEWPLDRFHFEQILGQHGSQVFVARNNEQVVGFIDIRKDEENNGRFVRVV